MARALVLRHHDEDHAGLIGEALVARGFDLDAVMMNEASPTPVVDPYDLLVILGSKSAVYDHEVERAWFGRELSVIARAEELAIPIFGICFGAQALCLYHGGVVRAAPEGEAEVGWYEIEPEPGVDLDAGPWFEFHYDRCELPTSATLWASSPRAPQAFAIGRHVGVQFHPEIDDDQLRDWLETAAEDAREFGHDPEELLAVTASHVPGATARARRLVDLVLSHVGLA